MLPSSLASAPTSQSPSQTVPPVPATPPREKKVQQFFLGLGVGLLGVPVCAEIINSLLTSLFLAAVYPLDLTFGGLALLAGGFLAVSKSHRFLGLGFLAGLALLTLVTFAFILFVVLSFNQYCSQSPAACG
jgi:hypothetical protein